MPPRVSDQGRHPGDADRRGNGRTLKILLIRLRLIGDVVFTTPAIAALRGRYPDADITYLVEAAAAPVVQHNPHLTRVLIADRPRGWARVRYDLALGRQLRRERFDVVIDFHGGPRSAWLTGASGAPMRIGYRLPGRFWAYTHRLPWTRALVPPRHSVLNQSALLQPLGIELPLPGRPAVEMPTDVAAADRVADRLRAAGAPEGCRLAVIHVSASSPFRRWPADRFAELATRLVRNDDNLHVVFTAGPDEQTLQNEIVAAAQTRQPSSAGRILRCGDVGLAELRALIDRAAVYIGGDSGPLHIAATSATPIVALFGPTPAERSMPWRPQGVPAIALDAGPLPCRPCNQRHCVPGDFRCLTGISVDDVAAAASTLLPRTRP